MNQLLAAGVELMLLGMSIVFLFLAVLVFVVKLMTFAVQHFAPEIQQPVGDAPLSPPSAEVVAAISAAIHRYRLQR